MKKAFKWLLPAILLVLAIIQFIPTPSVAAPAQGQRATHHLLQLEASKIFATWVVTRWQTGTR